MDQNSVFLTGEGDAWYQRNQAHLMDFRQVVGLSDVWYICTSLEPFKNNIQDVLEIGCSNGVKLEAICHELSAKGMGLEPSADAVEAGNLRNKTCDITLQTGSGECLPFESKTFDLVYFGFCLYLFDRTSLLKSLAEADRVLRPGGFLAITDFDPGSPRKRPYTHATGVYSYKQDYATFYTQSGLYYLLGKHAFSHRRPYFDEDAGERVATHILYKEIDPYITQD